MKNGIEELKPIYKTLKTLLEEVNQGNYSDFREYLIQHKLTGLGLYRKAKDLDLAHLSLALQGTYVSDLNLMLNEINAERIAKLNLQGTQVTHLNLAGNNIGYGIDKLKLQDTEIVHLNLRRNCIEADALANLNLQGTKVTHLDLGINNIGANGVANLHLQNTQVVYLGLGANNIGDGVANLRLQGTKVAYLGLKENNIEPDDLESLHLQGTQVSHLDLSGNGVANINLQDTQVVSLNLAGNVAKKIGADGISTLHLQGTKVICLDLSNNNIRDVGVKNLNLQGTQVFHLDLSNNLIGMVGATTFAQKIPGTSLLEVKIGVQNDVSDDDDFYKDEFIEFDVIKEALKANKQALIGKPLSAFWESYLDQTDSKPAKTLANIRAAGIPELQDLILSHLPGMAITIQYKNEIKPMGKLLEQLAKDKIENIKATDTENKLNKIN